MKFLSCALTMWGILWGMFIPPFLWLSAVGIVLMMVTCLFMDEQTN